MWLLIGKIFVGISIFFGFSTLFYYLRKNSLLKRKLYEAYETIDAVSIQRAREHKRELALLHRRKGYFYHMEEKLVYSGLPRQFPFLTTELWILALLFSGITAYFIGTWISQAWLIGLGIAAADVLLLLLLEELLAYRNYRAVEENLLEFLNLLGNYSITAGEVTGVLNQISRFVPEPLCTVLDECYYEAQTSGDANLALLSMGDKIEHPKFKEFIHNLEVCSRFSADYSVLIGNSRRELQDYKRARQERKTMATEALINMVMLLGMLLVTLILVNEMIDMSIWTILLDTIVGRVCMGIVGVLIALFTWEIATADK